MDVLLQVECKIRKALSEGLSIVYQKIFPSIVVYKSVE